MTTKIQLTALPPRHQRTDRQTRGTTPALAVVTNAVVDALAEFGVRHVEMPATSERVWRAIRTAQQGRSYKRQNWRLASRLTSERFGSGMITPSSGRSLRKAGVRDPFV